MFKAITKFIIYGLILYLFSVLGLPSHMPIKTVLVLAAVLTGVNTFIRPILVAAALPFNIITFGIASVFANLLALVIANAIVGNVISGFWVMLLIAFVIMLADDLVRVLRTRIQRQAERSAL